MMMMMMIMMMMMKMKWKCLSKGIQTGGGKGTLACFTKFAYHLDPKFVAMSS